MQIRILYRDIRPSSKPTRKLLYVNYGVHTKDILSSDAVAGLKRAGDTFPWSFGPAKSRRVWCLSFSHSTEMIVLVQNSWGLANASTLEEHGLACKQPSKQKGAWRRIQEENMHVITSRSEDAIWK